MADLKISQLTGATTPLAGTEVLPLVQSSTTKKVAVSDLTAGRDVSTKNITAGTTSVANTQVTVVASASNDANEPEFNLSSTVFANLNKPRIKSVNGTLGLLVESGSTSTFQKRARLRLDGGGAAQATIQTSTDNGSTYVDRVTVDASGNVTCTGATQTDGLVSHAGTGGAYQSNKFNFQWTGSAALWVDGTNIGNIATTSDYRVKKNVKSQTEAALPRVMKLRAVSYEFADYGDLFKADGVKREGFIAHEVQEIIPSGAEGQKDEQGRIQNLRVDAILSVVVKAMQEQQQQIELLKAELAALKGA